MPTIVCLRAASGLLALTLLLPAAAAAASKAFTGPAGWDHTVAMTATAQNPRASETWRKSDGQLMTYTADAGLSYDDMLAMVKKNIADNGFKPTVDTERKCDGRRAHELEMTFGTSVVHQVILDDAPGVTKLTYTRNQGLPMDADVTSAISAYCGPAT
jgi:hypothetical protein